ncbi:MAG: uroporphyrinogen-III C-methyltransferase [Flavobacteriales bacterium Tduv]
MYTNIGKVIFASAGPGDPELITMKAATRLQRAEVVLVDRLVSPELLERRVNPLAEIISVGKKSHCHNSMPQEKINALMARYALEGRYIVRLKGGDLSIFSNLLDELNALVKHGIPYEIIPGVTAASGAAAYSGIPLTARGYSSGVRFLTFYQTQAIDEAPWNELARTDDTLVFYMSVQKIEAIVERLLEHGIDSEKRLMIFEQATTPMQRVYSSPLHAYHEKIRSQELLTPSLLIVGKVVALHESFQWLPDNNSGKNYFNDLMDPSLSSFEKPYQSKQYVG